MNERFMFVNETSNVDGQTVRRQNNRTVPRVCARKHLSSGALPLFQHIEYINTLTTIEPSGDTATQPLKHHTERMLRRLVALYVYVYAFSCRATSC